MAYSPLPAWLQTSPRDFLAASEAGAAAGDRLAGLRTDSSIALAKLRQELRLNQDNNLARSVENQRAQAGQMQRAQMEQQQAAEAEKANQAEKQQADQAEKDRIAFQREQQTKKDQQQTIANAQVQERLGLDGEKIKQAGEATNAKAALSSKKIPAITNSQFYENSPVMKKEEQDTESAIKSGVPPLQAIQDHPTLIQYPPYANRWAPLYRAEIEKAGRTPKAVKDQSVSSMAAERSRLSQQVLDKTIPDPTRAAIQSRIGEIDQKMSGGKNDLVRVKHPDGTFGFLPASKLEAAKKAGYEEAPAQAEPDSQPPPDIQLPPENQDQPQE